MRYLYLLVILIPVLFIVNSCSSNDPTMFQLTILAIPEEGGVVTPERTSFEEGREIEIFANPNEHWVFSEWEGDFEGTENNPIITMDSDKEIIARFVKRNYPLTITVEGEGTVRERVVPAKTTEYEHNTVVELTAEPQTGWEFAEWQGDLSGSENPQEVVIDSETEVTAVFNRITYPLTIEIIGEGSVEKEILSAKTTDYVIGTSVQLTAVPEGDFLFYEWSGDIGSANSSSNPVVIEMDEPKTVTAEFREGFELSTSVVPQGAGTIEPGSGVFISGSSVSIEANAAYGWRFAEWSGDITGSENPYDLTFSSDVALEGHFERLSYPVTIHNEPVDAGQVEIIVAEGSENEQGEYTYESQLELTAVPLAGWEFVEWQGNIGGADPAQNPITVEVNEALDIVAVYNLLPGTLRIENTISIGNEFAPDHFTVNVIEAVSDSIAGSGMMAPDDSLRFEGLEPGNYNVEIVDLNQTGCTTNTTPNPQNVAITAGEETFLNFRFSCGLFPQ